MTAAHFTLWTTKQTLARMHAHTRISGNSALWEKQTNLFSLTIDIFHIELLARPFSLWRFPWQCLSWGQQLASSAPP